MPVAVVTGASRGAGRGIACALGGYGCTVYVTGRSETPSDASLPRTIHATAAAVMAGIAVRVDHAYDAQSKALFERVRAEQGRLDILVNHTCALRDQLTAPGPFWQEPLEIVDMIEIGLRRGYVAWMSRRSAGDTGQCASKDREDLLALHLRDVESHEAGRGAADTERIARSEHHVLAQRAASDFGRVTAVR